MEYSAPKPLSYSIHSCSTSTPIYHPFNILDDAPNDPNSRWSGSGPAKSPPSTTTPQQPSIPSSTTTTTISDPLNYPGQVTKKKDYIIIDLGKPAIVQSITFGKFHRPHPCNVKLFRIWGSLAPGEGKGDFRALLAASSSSSSSSSPIRPRGPPHPTGPRMELLAQGELKNDTVPETVPLRWTNDRVAWFKSPHASRSAAIPPLPKYKPIIIPVRYIKIEPLSATGSNYNCSIWHISVQGHDDPRLVSPCLEVYEKWRASAALRLCLKHLRQTGHLEAFQALIKSATNPLQSPLLILPSSNSIFGSASKSTEDIFSRTHLDPTTPEESQSPEPARFYFEHPLVSALHSALVPYLQPSSRLNDLVDSASTGPSDIRFKIPPISEAEQVVIQAALENLFDPWASTEPPTLTSQQILPLSTLSSELPGPRGGHQMCIDSKRRKIWLFGGFDGMKDLGDLWVYHLEPAHLSLQQESPPPSTMMNNDLRFKETMDSRPTLQSHDDTQTRYNRWQLISRNVKLENGPINRSCHKMVLDEMTGDLYVLGRYTERGRPVIPQASDWGTTNGHSPIHPGGRQMGEVSRNLQVPDTSGATAQSELNVDELMGDPEDLPGPTSVLPSSTRKFKNDMFRFRPFKDPSSDELWDNNGRIGEWECLSQDTYAENGPELIFDHQMVLDSDRRKMYVFGGKIIQPLDSSSQETAGSSLRGSLSQYSGLFEYDLTTQTWIQLMTDPEPSTTATTETQFMDVQRSIPSRMGHSLILDKKRDCLWVLTGERDQHYYSDIWRYNLRNCQAELIDADYTHAGRHLQTSDIFSKLSVAAPEAGFSQRTTFDSEADEWHMFCGLCRDRGSGEVASKSNPKSEMMSSEFWRYSVKEGRWTKAIMKPQVDGAETPPPRFAHQMVFDDLTKTHYVFGGNPADNDNEPTRLGDFWKLKLIQPTRREALRRCLFALRRQHFIEMCEKPTDTVGALLYLQNDLSSVTNHLDEREAKLFRACTSYLLAGPGPRAPLLEEEDAHNNHLEGQYVHENGEEDYAIKSHEPLDFRNGAHNNNNHEDEEDFTTVEHPHRYDDIRTQRTHLFQCLLKFFPPSVTEPEESLADLIDVWGDRVALG